MSGTSNPNITTFFDGSDALKASGQTISFYHVSSGTALYFKAFIQAFNESFNSDWATEKVYGRTDAIKLFKDTERRITLGFTVPAASVEEAKFNLAQLQKLIQFLYPNYQSQERGGDWTAANNISSSPLVRVRVVNFLSKEASMNTDASQGMLGVISNFTVNYNLETPDGVIEDELGVLPKSIMINMDFTVLHETTLGWNENNTFMSAKYPYNISSRAFDPLTSAPVPIAADNQLDPGELDNESSGVPSDGAGDGDDEVGTTGQSDQAWETDIAPDDPGLGGYLHQDRNAEAAKNYDNEVNRLDSRWADFSPQRYLRGKFSWYGNK